MSSFSQNKRVVSGMRATGRLHLGHYHGVIRNWLDLQHHYECFFFVADWHALTTHYESPENMQSHVWDLVIDWLACGINPSLSHVFIQSWVPEHAELHLLLSMLTPLSWLERVPTYKDQQEKLHERDLATYGFLGYPLLQSADVLLYGADLVPVGEDQVAHVELIREVARRFNHLYGKEKNFEEMVDAALKKMGKKNMALYRHLRQAFQQNGEHEALATGQALVNAQASLSVGDKERLLGYLEGSGKIILSEPKALLTPQAKVTGLDGQKMSKSYRNTVDLRDTPKEIEKKILTMPTDPARVKRTDPGNPDKCPVWQMHQLYADDSLKNWIQNGCRQASIGCIDCKRPLIDSIQKDLSPVQANIQDLKDDLSVVKHLVTEGSERAREVAQKTLVEVKEVMGLDY
jgi:tryptophanyl-tRNA synthetase